MLAFLVCSAHWGTSWETLRCILLQLAFSLTSLIFDVVSWLNLCSVMLMLHICYLWETFLCRDKMSEVKSSHRHYWTIFYLRQLPPFTHPCLLPSSDKQRNISDCWENTRRSQRDIKDSFSGGESDREVFSSLPYRTMKTFYDKLILSVTHRGHTNRMFLSHTPCRQTSFLSLIM